MRTARHLSLRRAVLQIGFALSVMIGVALPVHAEVIERLFFLPTERAQLEQQQAQQTLKAQLEADKDKDGGGQAVITVNGMIKRDDGSRIAWINGKAQKFGPSASPNLVPVNVPGKSKPVEVKVGQRVIVENVIQAKSPEPNSKNVKKKEDDD